MIELTDKQEKELRLIAKAGLNLMEIAKSTPDLKVDVLIALNEIHHLEKRWFVLQGIDRTEFNNQIRRENEPK